MLVEDPSILGTDLLVIGRQVPTGHGGFIDLLAVDMDGRVHVLELKRDRPPRDVVAQTLDYGSWVKDITLEDIEQLYVDSNAADRSLADAFAARFDQPLPDVVNAEQQFTIVASALDPASDRIVESLAEEHGVPINAVFFRHFTDDDRDYLPARGSSHRRMPRSRPPGRPSGRCAPGTARRAAPGQDRGATAALEAPAAMLGSRTSDSRPGSFEYCEYGSDRAYWRASREEPL